MGNHTLPGFWTVQGAAEITGLHPDTIRYHCRTGTLQAIDAGRMFLISDDELDRFIHDRLTRGKTL